MHAPGWQHSKMSLRNPHKGFELPSLSFVGGPQLGFHQPAVGAGDVDSSAALSEAVPYGAAQLALLMEHTVCCTPRFSARLTSTGSHLAYKVWKGGDLTVS